MKNIISKSTIVLLILLSIQVLGSSQVKSNFRYFKGSKEKDLQTATIHHLSGEISIGKILIVKDSSIILWPVGIAYTQESFEKYAIQINAKDIKEITLEGKKISMKHTLRGSFVGGILGTAIGHLAMIVIYVSVPSDSENYWIVSSSFITISLFAPILGTLIGIKDGNKKDIHQIKSKKHLIDGEQQSFYSSKNILRKYALFKIQVPS